MMIAPPTTWPRPIGSARKTAPRMTAPTGTRNWVEVTRVGPTSRIALNTNTFAIPAASAPAYRIASAAWGENVTGPALAASQTPNGASTTAPATTVQVVAGRGSTVRRIRAPATVYTAPAEGPVTLSRLEHMKRAGEKIVALTAYDASFARLVDAAGVDLVLVGDSLGNVIQGHASTLPVSMDDMVYHSRAVARGLARAFFVADMPFASYPDPVTAFRNAARCTPLVGVSSTSSMTASSMPLPFSRRKMSAPGCRS